MSSLPSRVDCSHTDPLRYSPEGPVVMDYQPRLLDGDLASVDRREFLTIVGSASAAIVGGSAISPATDSPPLAKPSPIQNTQAIVIGIEKTNGQKQLKRAPQDAKRIVDWLLSKGRLKPTDITLLSTPILRHAKLPASHCVEADRDTIVSTIDAVAAGSGPDERLIFYFSGHGMSAPQEGTPQFANQHDVLLPSDYDPVKKQDLSIEWLFKTLWVSKFVEQHFFLDCCRTQNSSATESIGFKGPPRIADPRVRQFVLYSVSPGQVAHDKGPFTGALLDALSRGVGAAEFAHDHYEVAWDKLAQFIKKQVSALGGGNPQSDIRPFNDIQKFPVVVRLLPKIDVPTVKLKLVIEPKAAIPQISQIDLTGEGAKVHLSKGAIKSPLVIDLYPRTYSVSVGAVGYDDPGNSVPLLEDSDLTVTLTEGTPTEQTFAPIMRGIGSLTLSSNDTFCSLELRDSNGRPLKGGTQPAPYGLGRLRVPRLKSGLYQARACGADGRVFEQVVSVYGGTANRLNFVTESGPRVNHPQELIAGLWGWAGGSTPSRPTPSASDGETRQRLPPLPTLLALASWGMDQEPEWKAHLEKIGLSAFPEGQSGFRILLAIGGESPERQRDALDRYELQLQPLSGTERPPLKAPASEVPSFRVFTETATEGTYRLRLKRAKDARRPEELVDLVLTLLRGRLCQLIVFEDARGQIHITQFGPEAHSTGNLSAEMIRQLDFVERDLQAGRGRKASVILEDFDQLPAFDPVAASLALLRRWLDGDATALLREANKSLGTFPRLVDGYVASGWSFEFLKQPEKAVTAYRNALDNGVPTTRYFLEFLYEGISRLSGDYPQIIEHPQFKVLRSIYENRILSLLWCAYDHDQSVTPRNSVSKRKRP